MLVGEPGVGKSTLLEHGVALAEEMRVLRARGIESEAELEYSGLLELTRPILDCLDALPGPQADALRVAFGLGGGAAPDRFVVGAAALSLLAAAGEQVPTLAVIDDAQWLDRASSDALRFAARRLLADRVGFLVASRPGGFDTAGLSEVVVGGLAADEVAALAAASRGRSLAPRDVELLVEATAGNPLAVIELSREQSAPPGPAEPLAVTTAIERAFAGRLSDLPVKASRALCVAAVAAGASVASLDSALRACGLALGDLTPAEDAGLVVISIEGVQFEHPLLRSVAYHTQPASRRRAAHAALAAALSGTADQERRAWHLASAALGPDEEAASALVAAAATARGRGGQAAVAEALVRAARLTADDKERHARLASAAQAVWDAGDVTRAAALVQEVLAFEVGPVARARMQGLAGRIEFQAGSLERAHDTLLDAVESLVEAGEHEEAVTLLGVATLILHNLARVDDAIALSRRATKLAESEPDAIRMRATYHLGRALQIAGRTDEAEPLLDEVVAHLLASPSPSRFSLQRAAIALAVLGRSDRAMVLALRTMEAAQAAGPLQVVYALSLVAQIEMHAGRWNDASASATEGMSLANDMGQENIAATFASFLVRLAGARGDAETFARLAPIARAAVVASGNRFERLQLDHAEAQLALAHDRLDDAADRLTTLAFEIETLGVLDRDLAAEPDLVDVLVRLGRLDEASAWLDRWVTRGAGGARPWAPPVITSYRSILDVAVSTREWSAPADATNSVAGDPFVLSRSQLLLGELLRRRGLRTEARRLAHLRSRGARSPRCRRLGGARPAGASCQWCKATPRRFSG